MEIEALKAQAVAARSFYRFKKEENKDKKHYCTLDNYHWICNECYNDFEKMFKFWKKVKKVKKSSCKGICQAL